MTLWPELTRCAARAPIACFSARAISAAIPWSGSNLAFGLMADDRASVRAFKIALLHQDRRDPAGRWIPTHRERP